MRATRLSLIFGRTSVWLAIGMLLFPGTSFAQCSCSIGKTGVSPRQGVSACCCQTDSNRGSEHGISVSSCCSPSGAHHCGSDDCHCGCSQKNYPAPQETPQPASPSPLEQVDLGLADLATAPYDPSDSVFQVNSSQFQQLLPITALERCIALSRFTC